MKLIILNLPFFIEENWFDQSRVQFLRLHRLNTHLTPDLSLHYRAQRERLVQLVDDDISPELIQIFPWAFSRRIPISDDKAA